MKFQPWNINFHDDVVEDDEDVVSEGSPFSISLALILSSQVSKLLLCFCVPIAFHSVLILENNNPTKITPLLYINHSEHTEDCVLCYDLIIWSLTAQIY